MMWKLQIWNAAVTIMLIVLCTHTCSGQGLPFERSVNLGLNFQASNENIPRKTGFSAAYTIRTSAQNRLAVQMGLGGDLVRYHRDLMVVHPYITYEDMDMTALLISLPILASFRPFIESNRWQIAAGPSPELIPRSWGKGTEKFYSQMTNAYYSHQVSKQIEALGFEVALRANATYQFDFGSRSYHAGISYRKRVYTTESDYSVPFLDHVQVFIGLRW